MAKPKPNTKGIKAETKPWLDSFNDIVLWAIPITGIIACGAHTISWLTKEEDEKEQKHIRKTLKKIITWTLVAELIPTIFKIFSM